MKTKEEIEIEDFDYIIENSEIGRMAGKTILVTGATGLIGQNIVKLFVYWNIYKMDRDMISILAVVRNGDKLKEIFHEKYMLGVTIIETDIRNLDISGFDIDYVIHAASITSSKRFLSEPTEIILTNILGTRQLLECVKNKNIQSLVYLSTMEVYGASSDNTRILETSECNIDTMAVRSCYPESKRLCENLCASYGKEYGVPIRVARLTQTFGPGVEYHDGRVFAEFARCAIEGKNIILHTEGLTQRSYLYIADALTAIITIMIKGNDGEAYNVANEDTYCSIREMAELVAEQIADVPIEIEIKKEINENFGYAPTLHMNLDTGKLKMLGWKAEFSLTDSYKRMIACMQIRK